MKRSTFVLAALLLAASQLQGYSHWKIKDGTGSAIVKDSGSFKLDGSVVNSRRCTWAREDDRGFFLTFDRGGCVKVPHDPKLSFQRGFEAEIFFSCDLSKIGKSNFACLLSKGDKYDRGYSIMVKKDGTLLVTLNGVPQHSYGLLRSVRIESNKDTRLKVTCDNRHVRVYVNGKYATAYPVGGKFKDLGEALHLGGTDAYPFSGNIYDVKLSGMDEEGSKIELTELEKLQNFKAPKVADPEGTVMISDFSKFGPASALDFGHGAVAHKYIIRKDASFWGNGVSTMIFPANSADAPDITFDPQLKGKYDVYLSVRSVGQDAVTQALVGDRYFRVVSKGLGRKHRSYEVLLARDVDMTGRKIGLAASVGSYVGYFKLIPSATPRQGEVPDPAGSSFAAPRMTEKDIEEWSDKLAEAKIREGMFRVRTYVETRKCAEPSEESQKRGYQLFARDWMDLCFEVSVPTRDTGKVSLAAEAAPGEFEPVTLCVRPLKDMGKVSLRCGAFTGPDGKPAEIECRIGVVEELMKRMTNFSGNSEVMKAPIYIEKTTEIPKLQKDVTRQFWITLRAPDDAKPGVYRTELELATDTGVERVPLWFEVYPFKLDRHGLSLTFSGLSNAGRREGFEKVFKDYADHGMTSIMLKYCGAFPFKGDSADTAAIDWERSTLPELMRLARKYGLDETVRLIMVEVHNEAAKYGDRFEEVETRMLLDLKKKAEENNWPPIQLMSFDEILSETHDMPKALADARIIHKIGMINVNDHIWYKTSRPYQKFCDEFCPLNDVFMNRFNTKNFWYVDTWKEMQERCDKEGKKLFPYNSNNAVMFSQPAAARYSYGWFHRTAGKGSIGHSMYTYFEVYGTPYNDLDGSYTDWLCNYPATSTRKGGPAIDWESYREGSDDMRYIATLEHRIETAEKRGIDVSEEKALLAKLVNSFDMKKFYAESTFITPKWTRTWTENGKHYASGVYNVPTGWEFEDYHNARRALAKAIIAIDRKLGNGK